MKKQITYLIPSPQFFSQLDGIGGHIAHTLGIVKGMTQHGYQVTLVTPPIPSEIDRELSSLGVDCVQLEPRPFFRLQALLLGARIARERDSCALYLRYSLRLAPFLPFLAGRLRGIPLILEVNSLSTSYGVPLYRYLENYGVTAASLIVCVSQKVLDALPASARGKALYLPNGVDIERFVSNSAEHLPHPTPRIGFFGSLKLGYGIEMLLEVVRSVARENPLEMRIYGTGPLLPELMSRYKALPHLRFMGPIPRATVPAAMAECDILVNTAAHSECPRSPIKLFEYLAARRAVLQAVTREVLGLVQDGTEALLYDPSSPRDCEEKLRRLLLSTELRESLAERGYQRALSSHTWRSRVGVLLQQLSLPAACNPDGAGTITATP